MCEKKFTREICLRVTKGGKMEDGIIAERTTEKAKGVVEKKKKSKVKKII